MAKRTSLLRLAIVTLAMTLATGAAAGLGACGGASGGSLKASASPSASSPASAAASRVVATVNGQPVLQSAVDVVSAEKRFTGHRASAAAALTEAIDRELVRQEAQRLGVTADASVVRSRSAALTKEIGGAAALAAALTKARMTPAQLSETLQDGVLRAALEKAKFGTVVASMAATRAYYVKHRQDQFTVPASVHLSMLVVRTQMIARNAIAQVYAGSSFASVARAFSMDPASRQAGGDVGWVLTSSVPGLLQKAVSAARTGVVSKPVPGPGGWYVFRVSARRVARTLPFASVRARLRADLTAVKRSRALDAWLAGERRRAVVKRF